MSEFLLRGWNVAILEVDVGDDIFVVRDSDGHMYRIQVKTGMVKRYLNDVGHSCKYYLKRSQLVTPITPEIIYVFVSRSEKRWESFLIIPRSELYTLYVSKNSNSSGSGGIGIHISYRDKVTIWKQDASQFVDNWTNFPSIVH
jgi:hypothetical protein